jgi:hypothetical protein
MSITRRTLFGLIPAAAVAAVVKLEPSAAETMGGLLKRQFPLEPMAPLDFRECYFFQRALTDAYMPNIKPYAALGELEVDLK